MTIQTTAKHFNRQEILTRALASLARFGEIFTDAPECAATVAAANNLITLAERLTAGPTDLCQGKLKSDAGQSFNADCQIDGSLIVELPDDLDEFEYKWRFHPEGSDESFSVSLYGGEFADDASFVIDEADVFYEQIALSHTSSTETASCVRHPNEASTADERAEVLKELKSNGLNFAECVKAFAVSDEDPYVKKARSLILNDSDLEIDGHTITSVGEEGAWVLSWLWVSNTDAGILYNADLLEEVLNYARKILAGEHGLNADVKKQRDAQADWLEDLITNYSVELDEIENEEPKGIPGSVTWVDSNMEAFTFMPSDAINQLRLLARLGGLPDELANQAEAFSLKYSNKLDAILNVIQVA